MAPKVEAAKSEDNTTENDESIVYFLQLLAVLCGQRTPLSLQEKGMMCGVCCIVQCFCYR